MKKISDSYLYKSIDYSKQLFSYLMSAERVDKSSQGFADINYSVKKQSQLVIHKVLMSNKVVLMLSPKGVTRVFKVIYVKDPKDNNNRKVFIDCADVIKYENGEYVCKKISTLISYLTAAMIYVIYYNNPKSITNNSVIVKLGASAFADLMLYTLGYLKIPISYNDNKQRMIFALAEYYQVCVLGLENSEGVMHVAKLISGIKEQRTCDYLHTSFGFILDPINCDLKKYIVKFAEVFLDQKEDHTGIVPKNKIRLTTDAVVQQWAYGFGPGTIFGLECFVPFAQMLTDCFNGAYLNQQVTIEKVAKSKVITQFTTELLRIGAENS